MRILVPAALALLAALPSAGAQPLRSVVVPADATVAIPPRGQPLPQLARAPLAPSPPALPPPLPVAAAPLGLGSLPGMLLPLAAAALLGGTSPGSSTTTTAPSTTR